MLIPEHKFLVEKVGPTEKTPDGKHQFQTIILVKPGYTDEFGEKIGKDDIYECRAWNKTLEEMPVLKKGDKVKAVLNLNGRQFLDKNNSEIYYNLQLIIRKIELL